MGGSVIVMEPEDYQEWLTTGNTGGETPEQAGERLFTALGCVACHGANAVQRAPKLDGVFGSEVKLSTGETVTADEQYLRESILHSQAKLVAGYEAIMPIYDNQIGEEDLLNLLAYIKSLAATEGAAAQ